MMLMQSRPGTKIVPAKLRRQAKNMTLHFTLRRARLQHCVVHADVFTARIKFTKRRREFSGAVSRRDLFKQARGCGKMFTQSIDQSTGAPQEHPAIPEIVPRRYEFSRAICVRLFYEAAHPEGLCA